MVNDLDKKYYEKYSHYTVKEENATLSRHPALTGYRNDRRCTDSWILGRHVHII